MANKLIDEIGKKYGRWLILNRAESHNGISRYLCQCDCGTIKPIYITSLRSGESTSCGCYSVSLKRPSNIIDEVGNKYGRWTVIAFSFIQNKQAYWTCRCDCGKVKNVAGSNLRKGTSTSCGCYQKERSFDTHAKQYGEASFNALYNLYKRHAKSRGYDFYLSKENVKQITKQRCFYCGCEPNQTFHNKAAQHNGAYIYNGIDRVDNTKGYVIHNVVPCCGMCNFMKHSMNNDVFLNHIEKIHQHQLSLRASNTACTRQGVGVALSSNNQGDTPCG